MRTIGVKWSYYNDERFEKLNEQYLPFKGEGETMATQLITALNKLVYKWYNDGDVYDNTYYLSGWCNDLSSYANWIYKHYPQSRGILEDIDITAIGADYEHLLKKLWDTFTDEDFLANENKKDKIDSIYKGIDEPFTFTDDEEDEEGWW